MNITKKFFKMYVNYLSQVVNSSQERVVLENKLFDKIQYLVRYFHNTNFKMHYRTSKMWTYQEIGQGRGSSWLQIIPFEILQNLMNK